MDLNSLWLSDVRDFGQRNGLLPDGTQTLPEPLPELIINEMLWDSFQDDIYLNTQFINPEVVFSIYPFEITATSSRDNELTWRLRVFNRQRFELTQTHTHMKTGKPTQNCSWHLAQITHLSCNVYVRVTDISSYLFIWYQALYSDDSL